MSDSTNPKSVLLLGMHRSGTSALARVVNLLGVDLGPDLMPAKPGVNERGFWESEALVRLHDRLLDLLNVAWSDTRPLPAEWWRRGDVLPLRDEMAALLRESFGASDWWGVKDPRLCRLLPIWRSILAELCSDPLCVTIVRHPVEVAESLARRDGLDHAHAHQLWLLHALESEEGSRGLPRAFVCYEDLLRDWRGSVAAIAERLGIAWPRDAGTAGAEIDAFLSDDLRHHVVHDARGDAQLPTWVADGYAALVRAAREGESPALIETFDAVRREAAAAEQLYGPALFRSHNALRAREAELAEARGEIQSREAERRRMRREIADRSRALEEAQQHAARRDAQVDEAMKALQGAQAEANTNREWALNQQAEIERLRGIIELRNARIDEYVQEVGRRGVDLARLQREREDWRRQQEVQTQHAQRLAERLRETEQRVVETDAQRAGAEARAEAGWRAAAEHVHVNNELRGQLAALAAEVEDLRAAETVARSELDAIRRSRTWRWSRAPRAFWSRLRGRSRLAPAAETPARDGEAHVVSDESRELESEPPCEREDGTPPLSLQVPCAEVPRVSIVIPVFDHVDHTLACLRAVVANSGAVPYEAIVVDDGSSDDTRRLGERVAGVRIVRSEENRGFVEACNLGAQAARGDLLLFLNNDTEVRPGWLAALVETFERHPRVGAVGAKLLGSDGWLQEAGGIIWADGSGWNVGRGDNPQLPEYQYLREVDYCSGACLLVPRGLFEELGGFDRRFAPAYYEDVDLCFAIRRAGLRVLYQPRAEVVHAEGVTAGRDLERGVKRFQAVNHATFVDKWAHELAQQPSPGSDPRRARGRGRRRVLVVDARTPMPDNDAGSLRMARLLRLLVGMGCHVTFSPEIPVYGGHYTDTLQAAGIEVLYDAEPSFETLAQHLAEHGHSYDVVLLSRFYVARNWTELVCWHCPQAKLVFDTVDLHFVRERREATVAGQADREAGLQHIRAEELRAAQEADLTITVSEHERQILLAEAGDVAVAVLPTIHDVEPSGRGFWEREGLVYVGSFQHKPNGDAIVWYAREIEPLLQQALPGLVLTVIGGDVPESLAALASPTIRFVGQQPDLRPWFEAARLSIAPLRFGAGVKGKILTSQSFGVPVVTTPLGAEGLHARDGEELLVAEEPGSFARAVLRLYSDPELWERMSRAGMAAVEQRFSFAVAERALRQILDLEDDAPQAQQPAPAPEDDRERRLEREIERYREVENVHDLPAIYHYWSNRYLLDKLQACSIRGVDEFFLDAIASACRAQPAATIEVASIGAGNGDLEVRLARALREQELRNFRFQCVEINPHMIERGKALALSEGVEAHLVFEECDIASWQPRGPLAVCMANHSLHHIDELELLFDRVKAAIDPDGVFLINDMIGRNGHQRWPEALEQVQSIWKSMPDRYKYNHLLRRFEPEYLDWDCSQDGNEGIRAQDILPLLLERFHFEVFVAFANLVDVFIDRAFGHNFDPESEEDRAFIDRVARLDEELIDIGVVKPTHMIAALRSRPVGRTIRVRHWTPEFSVRYP